MSLKYCLSEAFFFFLLPSRNWQGKLRSWNTQPQVKGHSQSPKQAPGKGCQSVTRPQMFSTDSECGEKSNPMINTVSFTLTLTDPILSQTAKRETEMQDLSHQTGCLTLSDEDGPPLEEIWPFYNPVYSSISQGVLCQSLSRGVTRKTQGHCKASGSNPLSYWS